MASKKRKLKEEDHNNDQDSESVTSTLNTMGDDECSSRLKTKKKKTVSRKGFNLKVKKKELKGANTRKDDHPLTAQVQHEDKQSSPAEGPSAVMTAATSNQASSYQQHFDKNQPVSADPSYQLPPRFDSLNQPGSSSGVTRAPLRLSRRGRPRKGSLNQPGSSSGFTRAPLSQSRRGRPRKGSLNQPGSSSNPASVAPPFQRYFDLNQPPSVTPLHQERSDLNQPVSVTPSYQQHFDLNQPPNQFLPCYDPLNQPGLSPKSGSNQASSSQLPPRFGSPYQPGSSPNPAFSCDAAYQLQALQQHQPLNPNVDTLPSTGAVGFLQGGRSTSSNAFALVARDGENKGDFGKTTESVTGSSSGNLTANDESNIPVVTTAGQVSSATDIDRSSSSTESDELQGYKKNADIFQKGNIRRNLTANDESNRPVVSTAGQVSSATDIDRSSSSTESDELQGYKKNADIFQKDNIRRKKRSSRRRRRYFPNTNKWNWLKFLYRKS